MQFRPRSTQHGADGFIGHSTSIDEGKYEAYLAEDNTGTGAVKAGDWISSEELAEMGIDADLTIFAE